MSNRRHSLWIAGIAVAAAAGGALLPRGGSEVVESAPRLQVSAPAAKAAPSGGGALVYLEPLPEPNPGTGRKPTSLSVPRPEPANVSVAPQARIAPRAAESGDCAQGARAMGDCNCYDEARGKVTLTLHPTQACIDEESKRLGHKLVLSRGEGRYELAGVEPERAPLPVSPLPSALGLAPPTTIPSAQAAAELPPPGSVNAKALVYMQKCNIRGHDVHLHVVSLGIITQTLHIRIGTHLPPALERARLLVLGGAGSASVFSDRIEAGGTVEKLSEPFVARNYASGGGFDDGKMANAYAATLGPAFQVRRGFRSVASVPNRLRATVIIRRRR